jgi:RNA polymerase sigma-70 factor, ECF subfamily
MGAKRVLVPPQKPGSRELFERLHERSYPRAFTLGRRLTGNDSDAEDLVQEACLRAWAAFDRYDRRVPFDVWFLRIVNNLAIDRWRRKSLIRLLPLDQPIRTGKGETVALDLPDRRAGPERLAISTAGTALIEAHLDLLPEAYRVAILLADIEDWSYEEVAQKMHCPVGTVRSRLHRGRQLLRQSLEAAGIVP